MSRTILVIRHGQDQGTPDGRRVLSDYGVAQILRSWDLARRKISGIPHCFHGPAERAKQSALVLGLPSAEMFELGEDAGCEGLHAAIMKLQNGIGDAVLIGHNPSVTECYQELIGADSETEDRPFNCGEGFLIRTGKRLTHQIEAHRLGAANKSSAVR